VALAGLVAVLATRPPAVTQEARNPLDGRPAPPVAGRTVTGVSFRLPDPPGRFVLLNFFASWCVPCQQEGPELVRFAFEHRATHDATVVSVVFQDDAASARNAQALLGATWPTLADPTGSIAQSYGVEHLPTNFLIAPDGRVVAYIPEGVTAAGLDAVLRRLESQG
jgi:thiol-disulfide isomerase/thioredoxin